MNTEDLLKRYETSHFDRFIDPQDMATPADKERAKREYEADPARALIENVDQAKRDVSDTRMRLMEASQDGLFDPDGFRAAGKQQKRRWVAAIETVRGDLQRAVSELAHWREYVRWAMEEQVAKVARLEASVPDRRLPPETDEVRE